MDAMIVRTFAVLAFFLLLQVANRSYSGILGYYHCDFYNTYKYENNLEKIQHEYARIFESKREVDLFINDSMNLNGPLENESLGEVERNFDTEEYRYKYQNFINSEKIDLSKKASIDDWGLGKENRELKYMYSNARKYVVYDYIMLGCSISLMGGALLSIIFLIFIR